METTKKVEKQYSDRLISEIEPIEGKYVSMERQRKDKYLNEAKNLEYRRYRVIKNNRSRLFESIGI